MNLREGSVRHIATWCTLTRFASRRFVGRSLIALLCVPACGCATALGARGAASPERTSTEVQVLRRSTPTEVTEPADAQLHVTNAAVQDGGWSLEVRQQPRW